MKKTPAKDLRNLSATDLESEVRTLRREISALRMGIALRSEKDTAKLSRDRRQLARLLTILKEKQQKPLKKAASAATVPAHKSAA